MPTPCLARVPVPAALVLAALLPLGSSDATALRLFGAAPAAAQEARAARTAAADPARSARVDSLFERFTRPGSPGCAVGVVRDGRLVHARGYGLANLDHEIALDARSVFYAASVSKQFTAAAVALLALQGKLSLDDDVREYVPELPDYGHTITIRHLVHHTSGIRDYLTLMALAGERYEDVRPVDAIVALISRQRELNFRPGAEFLYSNTGYILLAEIVARVTGTSLREFAESEIFGPLGMADSHFHDDHTMVVPRRALGYSPAEDGGSRLNHLLNFELVGDGGLLTTVEDLARWDANFERGAVGGAAFLRRIHEAGVLGNGDTLDYAFGLRHGRYRGLRTVGHGGSLAGFRTQFLRFPDQRLTVICLCNRSDAGAAALARRVAEVYLADRLGPAPATAEEPEPDRESDREPAKAAAPADATVLNAFAGRYHSGELGARYEVLRGHDGLLLRRRNAPDRPLEPVDSDRFTAGNLTLDFVRDGADRITGFRLGAGRVRNLLFEREEA